MLSNTGLGARGASPPSSELLHAISVSEGSSRAYTDSDGSRPSSPIVGVGVNVGEEAAGTLLSLSPLPTSNTTPSLLAATLASSIWGMKLPLALALAGGAMASALAGGTDGGGGSGLRFAVGGGDGPRCLLLAPKSRLVERLPLFERKSDEHTLAGAGVGAARRKFQSWLYMYVNGGMVPGMGGGPSEYPNNTNSWLCCLFANT